MNEIESMFSGFEDDEDEGLTSDTSKPIVGTLIKIMKNSVLDKASPIKVAYIADGLLTELEDLHKFLIDAELAKYVSKEAVGVYSETVIEDMTRTANISYKIIEGIQPTQIEISSAYLFNAKYGHYAED